MSSSPTLRPPRVSDLDEIVDLINRDNTLTGIPVVVERDELWEEWNSSLTSMERDCRVLSVDGRLRGVAWTLFLPSESTVQRCYVEGAVDPDLRRNGHGRTLMDWGVNHARELLQTLATSDQPRSIRVQHRVDDTSRLELMREYDFSPVRWFDDLERPLVDVPTPVSITDITIEPWPSDDESVRRVKNIAFADHWGSSPTTPEGWEELVRGFGSRLDLSRVAVDTRTNEVVAFLLAKRYPSDDTTLRRTATVDKLGTLPKFRKRGIGSALIIEALHAFAQEDLTHALIDVDSSSPTGAHRLYESLGFELLFSTVTSEIVLS